MPRTAQPAPLQRLHGLALAAATGLHDSILQVLLSRLGAAYRRGESVTDMMELAEQILDGHQDDLADLQADVETAAFVSGAGRMAARVPVRIAMHATAPTLVTAGAPAWDDGPPVSWDGAAVWLPVVENAIEALRSKRLMLRPAYDRASEDIRRNAFTAAGVRTKESLKKVHQALIEAVADGTGLAEFQDKVAGEFSTSALGVGRLENVFRTNIQKVYSVGIERIVENPIVSSWLPFEATLPIRDSRLSELCHVVSRSGIQGTNIYLRADPEWQRLKPPRHFQCFLPGTIVQGRFNVALKMPYSGEVVEIMTRSGKRLSVTTNHPILTDSGFVAAGGLHEGDDLVSYGAAIEKWPDLQGREMSLSLISGLAVPTQDEQYPPAAIEDVFRAIVDLSGGVAWRSPTGPDDLYGDAAFSDGYVEVAGIDRELLFDEDTGISEGFCNERLIVMDRNLSFVSRDSDPDLLGLSFWEAAHGFPGCVALADDRSAILGDGSPLQFFRFGSASQLDAHCNKLPCQGTSVKPTYNAQRLEGLTGLVALGQAGDVRNSNRGGRNSSSQGSGLFHVSQFDSGSLQGTDHAIGADAAFARELRARYSSVVSLDDIVKIRKYQWSGHVYDLQSEGGWIVANGIFSSNCRCGRSPMTVEAAAEKGIRYAKKWLRLGRQPENPPYVPRVPVELPRGWLASV